MLLDKGSFPASWYHVPYCASLQMSVHPLSCLVLEAVFPNLGWMCAPGGGVGSALTVGQLAAIRAGELTLPRCIISGPTQSTVEIKSRDSGNGC